MRLVWFVAASMISGIACSGKAIDGGGLAHDSGLGASADAGPASLSGVYKGYAENFSFPDGSDTVTLTLIFASDGTVTGRVFFGDAPALAPPTDPSIGYPPSFEAALMTGHGTAWDEPTLESFAFTILEGTYGAQRLRLQIDPEEMWKQWCELQTTTFPVPCGDPDGGCDTGGYACVPGGGGVHMGDTCFDGTPATTLVDCGKFQLCSTAVCVCTSSSCTVPLVARGTPAFDMQLDDGSLDGSVIGLGVGSLNVHLTRE